MVCSMVAALVQALFATPGLSRFVRAVLDLFWIDIATCLLFVHWFSSVTVVSYSIPLRPASFLFIGLSPVTVVSYSIPLRLASSLPIEFSLVTVVSYSIPDLLVCKVLHIHTQVFPLLVTVVSHSIPDFLLHFHFPVDLPIRHGVVRRSYI